MALQDGYLYRASVADGRQHSDERGHTRSTMKDVNQVSLKGRGQSYIEYV